MHTIFLVLIVALFAGSLLSLSSNPHWLVRGWDFPRVQIVAIVLAIVMIHFAVHSWIAPATLLMRCLIVGVAATLVVWHACRIFPYTPIAANQAQNAAVKVRHSAIVNDRHLRLIVSNVQMENRSYDCWREVICSANPDVIIAVETDQHWLNEMEALSDRFPYKIVQAQDNYYGMVLLSRLAIETHEIRFLVENDVPSIDAMVELASGGKVRVIGVHPRPPEPVRDNDATARDAELVLWAKELENYQGPVVIGGDLNDVAWSQTTRLFLRISGLLDPRRGRGLFSTFHANHWWMRFPLDHIFHSTHFRIREIKRLPNVGSDHFPMLIDLQQAPQDPKENKVLAEKENDQQEASERIERASANNDLAVVPAKS
ncbi:hypothetical protein FF011L_37930 [Roseimaritima multifibrata]|uniref:Endonuclease/exonuclease/phosphatase domain-containing protein n=1 Tax=Roseimaritima multifibrata TaxID=1930274 RepID=A0A517MJE3_9BACT|nr:endonuclease/exonuclease/phosphatase family protein [Roseimaritima multifibrata]QDS95009.1 hypothetical protein FF011L_37930 [Roseimaritima multifibrata]